MFRFAVFALAFASAPAFAASQYHAAPVAPPGQERVVARDNLWRCGEAGCTTGRSGARPAIVCAMLVREVGALRSFNVQGRPFTAEELEICNRRAR